ncbi:MAG TPA: DUF6653 family protein [Mycobacterium sp.]|nr:DUF6653 family protein [Mycobacterium sp.]
MSLEARLANLFGLRSEDAWRRHANPWSVYTRIPIPPLIVAAIWSRAWIGWWSLMPIVVVLAWTAVNPRAFPAPRSLDSWASRSVLGETVWGRRREIPLPPRHRVAPVILSVVSAAGVPFLIWGLVVLDPWITAFGLAVQMAGKLWFLDRMALLYDDVGVSFGDGPPGTRQP